MGVIAVLVAALGGFATGAVWYMTLSKPWMDAAGIETDEQGRPRNSSSPVPFVVRGIAMILVAGMMRHVFATSGVETPIAGFVSGLGVGAFLITPWVAMNYAYAGRPLRLTVIDGGYSVLGPGVIGVILALI